MRRRTKTKQRRHDRTDGSGKKPLHSSADKPIRQKPETGTGKNKFQDSKRSNGKNIRLTERQSGIGLKIREQAVQELLYLGAPAFLPKRLLSGLFVSGVYLITGSRILETGLPT